MLRGILVATLLTGLCTCGTFAAERNSPDVSKPNLPFIITDEQFAGVMSRRDG